MTGRHEATHSTLILALLLALASSPAARAAQDTIHYQGHLVDALGLPLGEEVSIEFRLYSTPAGGTELWRETHLVRPDLGLFQVQLGSRTPIPAPVLDLAVVFLGISVEGGDELEPRSELSASPYAFRALSADLLGGATAKDLDQSEHLGDTGNPHGVNASQLGAATGVALAQHEADASAHHGNYWIADGADVIYTPRNFVGINIADPDATLHVRDSGTSKPAILVEGGSASEGDLAWPSDEFLQLGTWNSATGQFDQHMAIEPDGTVVVEEAIVFDDVSGDKISLFGDRLGQSSMYGFGIGSSTLEYKSSAHHRWYSGGRHLATLNASGLGLGTTAPNHELIVQGNDPVVQIRDDTTDNSGNAARLELLERAGGSFSGGAYFWWDGLTNRLLIGTKNGGDDTNRIVLDRSAGNVGIGTQSVDNGYKLSVNGSIRAKEVVVETGWSDYVFDDDYELRPLDQVHAYIEAHGHLPDIPSAQEVERDGVALGEMDARLLRKIEELTLYMLQMRQELDSVKEQNRQLRDSLERDGRRG